MSLPGERGFLMRKKVIAPAAINALKEALTYVYWYKSELRSFIWRLRPNHLCQAMCKKSIALVLSIMLALSFVLFGCDGDANNVKDANVNNPPAGENDDTILAYLDKNLIKPHFGGKVFSAYKILGNDSDQIHVWAYIMEFYKDGTNNSIEEGTGMSGPMVLRVNQSGNNVVVVNHTMPRDGAFYTGDIKKLFPQDVQEMIFSIHDTQIVEELSSQAEKRAKEWFQERDK